MKNELTPRQRVRRGYLARRDDIRMFFFWRRWHKRALRGEKTYFTCLDAATCAHITPQGKIIFEGPRLGLSPYNMVVILREFENSFTPEEKARYNLWLGENEVKSRIA